MKSYSQLLLDLLMIDGWEVKNIDKSVIESWADEVWKLTSTWPPKGVVTYITWLSEPIYEGTNEEHGIKKIGISKSFPSSIETAQKDGNLTLDKTFKSEIYDLSFTLEALRSK